ncbi:Laccase-4 [Rhizoctonia solani AG-1 IB]|uniref:Laccase-4 n=1 Tax=Thanatephorus cucumeris (strain AG1-IB / isolate 7/3/14) TaxID=1108050 RepID=M5C1A6_THACB|nr:Laccase-4 [Rhizoctonia solani AG-1 IB]
MLYNSIFTGLVLSGFSLAANVPYNFRIRNVQAAPDGFQRSVVAVNGLVPGTLITANKGDTLLINVTNEATHGCQHEAFHNYPLAWFISSQDGFGGWTGFRDPMPDFPVQFVHLPNSARSADRNLLVP